MNSLLRVCALTTALLVTGAIHADIVYLKNGKSMKGEVIRQDDNVVVLRVPFGEVTLKMSDVETIERQTPQEYKFELAKQALREEKYDSAVRILEELYIADRKSADLHRTLSNAYSMQARHYRELNRFVDARQTYEKLLKIDPHAERTSHHAAEAIEEILAQEKSGDALAASARDSMDQEKWAEALRIFEQYLAYTPDARTAAAPGMAICHVNLATEYAKAGRNLNAAAELEAAMRLDPTLADRFENIYAACALPAIMSNLNKADIVAAQVDLKRVLSFAPTNKNVLYVAGRVEEALNRRAGAADYYARALRTRVGNATPEFTSELRKRLEKELGISGTTWKIDTTFAELTGYATPLPGPAKTLDTENFTIIHFNDALAKEVSRRAESTRDKIMSDLGLKGWRGKAKVFLHRTQAEYTARTAQPEWTGGFSKFITEGTAVTALEIHSWQTSPRLLTSVLPHEITHLLVNSNLSEFNALPRSLHEGFAILMEPRYRQEYFLGFLRVRVKSESFIPLAELLSAKDYPRDPEFFYAEGYALLNYVSERSKDKSLQAITSLIKNAAPGKTGTELLRISGARSLDELETEWKAWILKQK